jgi:hypothetical protein
LAGAPQPHHPLPCQQRRFLHRLAGASHVSPTGGVAATVSPRRAVAGAVRGLARESDDFHESRRHRSDCCLRPRIVGLVRRRNLSGGLPVRRGRAGVSRPPTRASDVVLSSTEPATGPGLRSSWRSGSGPSGPACAEDCALATVPGRASTGTSSNSEPEQSTPSARTGGTRPGSGTCQLMAIWRSLASTVDPPCFRVRAGTVRRLPNCPADAAASSARHRRCS